MRYMSIRPDDLVLVHVTAPTSDHKIADQWEEIPHHVLSQLADQPFLEFSQWMLRMMKISEYYIEICYSPSNPFLSPMMNVDNKHFALMKANLLMDLYFDD